MCLSALLKKISSFLFAGQDQVILRQPPPTYDQSISLDDSELPAYEEISHIRLPNVERLEFGIEDTDLDLAPVIRESDGRAMQLSSFQALQESSMALEPADADIGTGNDREIWLTGGDKPPNYERVFGDQNQR